MNSGITLADVRKEAINTIKELRDKKIDYKTAGEIRNLLNGKISFRSQVAAMQLQLI